MNAIQMRRRIDELIDRTKTARHSDMAYWNSINGATMEIIKDRVEPIRVPRKYSIQSSQRLRDELYTLIPDPTTGTLSSGKLPYPTGYLYYLLLNVTIGGKTTYCRPTNFNELGPLKKNPFSKPSAVKPYFQEDKTGLKVITDAATTAGTYELYFLKTPDKVFGGKESDKITDGGTIVNTTVYYCIAKSVYDTVTYAVGDTFTGTATATLTSGIVIAAGNIVNSNMPENLHEEICILAASKLMGNVSDFNKKNDLKNEVEQN